MTHEQMKAWIERVLKKLGEPIYCAVTAAELVQVMIDELSAKRTATDLFDDGSINSAPERGDAQQGDAEDFIRTSKGKKLKGADLARFFDFWNAFDKKDGRAEAAGVWMAIADKKTSGFMTLILSAARTEASSRKNRTSTAVWAQRWLTGRRWEGHKVSNNVSPKDWTIEQWKTALGNPLERKFFFHFYKEKWSEQRMPGPNPWDQVNLEIPQDVRDIYAERWGWK